MFSFRSDWFGSLCFRSFMWDFEFKISLDINQFRRSFAMWDVIQKQQQHGRHCAREGKRPVICNNLSHILFYIFSFFAQKTRWMVSSCVRFNASICNDLLCFYVLLPDSLHRTHIARISTYQWIVRINYICNGHVQQHKIEMLRLNEWSVYTIP